MPRTAQSIHVETRGDGQATILLLHGGGVGGWMWHPLIDHLPAGRRMIVPDLPGHDRSAAAPYVSHEDALASIVAVLDEHTDAPVSVVGFSLGAQLAVLLASERPDLVSDAVVISAQAIPMRMPRTTLAMLAMAAPLARNQRFARAQAQELFIPDVLMDEYLRTSATISTADLVAAVGENIRFTVPDGWAAFPGRSLVLAGSDERRMMRSSAAILAERHPRSEMEIVDGCGHGIPLQRPAWLAQRLGEWWQAPSVL
ncbi:alpha/beta fold hydrolase [uncultured Microbacterium sp.]|uniref:alpha/beta fold hydrolase n=1 Tax=uncultured Microbacterium sp. TaxID=191216 RepID=UPI00263A060B|nr:alpha/beta fold hydrolase [uncultured Microbacterium sp.]